MKDLQHRARRRRVIGAIVAVAGLSFIAAIAAREHASRAQLRPPIVLITVDTLRADAVALEDVRADKTPFLAGLARNAVVFRNAYAPSSWTVPSMASLFTSLAPPSHGLTGKTSVRDQQVLSSSFATLAESLKAAGYVTIGVPTNPHLATDLGFAQGFDYYAISKVLPADQARAELKHQLEEASRSRRAEAQPPSFVWIHFMEPHAPYTPHEPWAEECVKQASLSNQDIVEMNPYDLTGKVQDRTSPFTRRARCLYDSEVRYLDDELRALNDTLGFDRDDALLIFTADHGEEFAEHHRFGHARTLYEEVVRVPLFIRWPRRLTGAGRIDTTVNLLDVYPTVLALLGMAVPAELQGHNLVPLMTGETSPPQAQFYQLTTGEWELKAVREGQWKLIRGHGLRSLQLFDLQQDPQEQSNCASDHPEIVGRLDSTYLHYDSALPKPPPETMREMAPEAAERLRQLGYGD